MTTYSFPHTAYRPANISYRVLLVALQTMLVFGAATMQLDESSLAYFAVSNIQATAANIMILSLAWIHWRTHASVQSVITSSAALQAISKSSILLMLVWVALSVAILVPSKPSFDYQFVSACKTMLTYFLGATLLSFYLIEKDHS